MSALNGGIRLDLPLAIPPYVTCDNTITVSDGDYYLDQATHSRVYRVIGGGGPNLACDMSLTPGSQKVDGNVSTVYWQEVGPVGSANDGTNYLKIIGYVPYVGTVGGLSGGGTARTQLCSSTAYVGALNYCPLTATFQVVTNSNLDVGGDHAPTIDTTHPLVVLGERQNGADASRSTFMSRVSDATLDAGNIAGEACLYVYAQEESGCYAVNALSGSEAAIAAIGPGSQNAMLYDFQAGNPASGDKQQQRLAGVYLDGRDGEPMKTVLHGTITPYNSPTPSVVPAGLKYIGEAGTTIESVHTENVQDGVYCDGDSGSGTTATCNILSTDPATGSGTETNTVHLGSNVKSAYVNTVRGPSTNALTDDTSDSYQQDGVYILGVSVGNFRTRIFPQAAPQSLVGPLLLASPTFAGALGLTQGTDTTGWPAHTATIEAPNSVTSYRFTLPAGASSGIIQGSTPVGSSLVTGTFSGDSKHSKHITLSGNQSYTPLCPSSSGGCDIPGLYRLTLYVYSTSICTGGTASVGPIEIKYTDETLTSKSDVIIPLFSSGTVSSSISLGNKTGYGWGTATIWSHGAPNDIQYQIVGWQSSCTSGSADYELDAGVEQLRGP